MSEFTLQREKFMLIFFPVLLLTTLGWCLLQQPRGRENNDQELKSKEKKRIEIGSPVSFKTTYPVTHRLFSKYTF